MICAGADDDKALAGGVNLAVDHIFDTAHKRENEDDTGDADGDAEAGQEGAGAVSGDLVVGEFIMSAEK